MDLTDLIIGASIPAITLVVFAGIAGLRAPSAGMRSAMQHLAAGVICAVVAAELVPRAMATQLPIEISLGFVSGLVLMLAAKAIAERLMGGRGRVGLLLASGLDVTIDGLLIGVAFALATATGFLLVLAFTLELAAVGLAIGAGGDASKPTSVRRSVTIASMLAAPVVPAAIVGKLMLSPMSAPFEAGLMGFSSAVLLYLVIEELMREAHEVEELPAANWLFFAGFLGLVLLQMQINH